MFRLKFDNGTFNCLRRNIYNSSKINAIIRDRFNLGLSSLFLFLWRTEIGRHVIFLTSIPVPNVMLKLRARRRRHFETLIYGCLHLICAFRSQHYRRVSVLPPSFFVSYLTLQQQPSTPNPLFNTLCKTRSILVDFIPQYSLDTRWEEKKS